MIVSKHSLQVVNVTTKDSKIPILDNVHFAQDGTVVGAASSVVLAVSPVVGKVRKAIQLEQVPLTEGVTVSSASVKQVIKNMPNDTLFGGLLEHCDVRYQGGSRVHFATHDGKQELSIAAAKNPAKYVDWRAILKRSLESRSEKRIILNRTRLRLLLETLDKVCPDASGESPVYLDFTKDDDIIVRARNMKTGQRALGVMKTFRFTEEAWLTETDWEKGLYHESGVPSDNARVTDTGVRTGVPVPSVDSKKSTLYRRKRRIA